MKGTNTPTVIMWWGYLHANGTIQLKRWFGDHGDYTKDCNNNPFVKKVAKPFPAPTRQMAFDLLASILEDQTT
jgi:hypothetical protein